MIDFAISEERQSGKSPEEAIYQACLLRFRPIMMTTMAALLGGCPWQSEVESAQSYEDRWALRS